MNGGISRIGALGLIYGSCCGPLLVIESSEPCEAAVRILNDTTVHVRRRERSISVF
jgi:hypothetical protein